MPHVPFSDGELEQIRDALARSEFRSSLRNGCLANRVSAQPYCLDEGGGYEDARFQLEWNRRALALLRKPWPQALAESRQLYRRTEQHLDSLSPWDARYEGSKLFCGPIPLFLMAAMRSVALNEMAQITLCVELYRRHSGSPPPTLAELVPEYFPSVPTDPFDGQPLRYRMTETGYLIYSVGADGTDSGGVELSASSPDIVISIPRITQ